MSGQESFDSRQALGDGLRAVLADRAWPLKVGVGGLLMLTLIGLILPQGFLVEHLDNSRRGFRTPMPMWRQWGDKAIMGLLTTVMDFVYFVLPFILGGLMLFCVGLGVIFNQRDGSSWALWLLPSIAGSFSLVSFALSLSPLAKASFSKDGEVEQSLGARALRRATDPLTRRLYFKARLASLPAYAPAVACGALFVYLAGQSGGSVLGLFGAGWLLSCSLFWAWLVVGQVYLPAIELADDRIIDARLAARRAALQNDESAGR